MAVPLLAMMVIVIMLIMVLMIVMIVMIYSPQIEKDIVNARNVKWHSRCQHHHCLYNDDHDGQDGNDAYDGEEDDDEDEDSSAPLSLPEIVNHWKHHEDCVVGRPCNQYCYHFHHDNKCNRNHHHYHYKKKVVIIYFNNFVTIIISLPAVKASTQTVKCCLWSYILSFNLSSAQGGV